MYVLILLCSLLAAPRQEPINKHLTANNKINRSTANAKSESPPNVTTNLPKDEPQPHPHSEGEENKARDGIYRIEVVPQADWWSKGYVIATLIIAVLNLGMLTVIWRQKSVMAGQLSEMKEARRQTDKLIAQAEAQVFEMKNAGMQTDRLIRQSEVSANAAQKSADALVNVERPWIVVTIREGFTQTFRYDIKTGENKNIVYFNWFLTNHGKTAALVYEIIALLEVKSHDEVEELRRIGAEGQPTLRPDAFIIGPGQSHEFSGITMVKFWTDEQRKAVFDRSAYLVAHGIVKYRDMIDSSATHQTPFIGLYVYAEQFNEGTFRRFYDAPGYNKYT